LCIIILIQFSKTLFALTFIQFLTLLGSFRWNERRLLNIIKMTLEETRKPNLDINNGNIESDLKVVLRVCQCN